MYTVLILTDKNRHVTVLKLLLEHRCFSQKDISIIIYYNPFKPMDNIPVSDIECTSLLVD